MKKITMITLLMITPFLIYGQTFNFNTDGDSEDWSGFGSTTRDVSGGVLTVTFTGAFNDVPVTYNGSSVSTSNKYLHILADIGSSEINAFSLQATTSAGSVLTGTVFTKPVGSGFNVYTIDLTGQANWTGTISDLRVRIRNTAGDGGLTANGETVKFDKIIFDNNAAPLVSSFEFNTDGDNEGWTGFGSTTRVVSGGNLTATVTGAFNDVPILYGNNIDTSNKFVHVVAEINSDAIDAISLQATTSTGAVLAGTSFSKPVGSGFNIYTIDLTGQANWSGDVTDLRFRMRNTAGDGELTVIGDTFVFDQIIFDNSATLSADSLEKFNFSYFPNPTKDRLQLSAAKSIKKVTLFNLLGQQVFTEMFNNQKTASLNVSSFKTGVYVMKVQIEDAVGTFKFLKE